MPKVVDHAAREVAIAEAAWAVLRERGIQGLSVRNVAAASGLAVGSLRRSFPTQRSLLRFCIQLVVSRAGERIRALQPLADPLAQAEQVLAQVLPLDGQRRLEMEVWLALSVGSLSDPELREECHENDAALAALCLRLMRELAEGELGAALDPEREASRLHALIDGLALQLIRQGADESCQWAVDVLHHHLLRLVEMPGRRSRVSAPARAGSGRS